ASGIGALSVTVWTPGVPAGAGGGTHRGQSQPSECEALSPLLSPCHGLSGKGAESEVERPVARLSPTPHKVGFWEEEQGSPPPSFCKSWDPLTKHADFGVGTRVGTP